MNNTIKNKLDNFDLSLLSFGELRQYNKCRESMFSKRACLLYLIDNYSPLTYDLQILKIAIDLREIRLQF